MFCRDPSLLLCRSHRGELTSLISYKCLLKTEQTILVISFLPLSLLVASQKLQICWQLNFLGSSKSWSNPSLCVSSMVQVAFSTEYSYPETSCLSNLHLFALFLPFPALFPSLWWMIFDSCQSGAIVGDGYSHLKTKPSEVSPHTEHELFYGVNIYRASKVCNSSHSNFLPFKTKINHRGPAI